MLEIFQTIITTIFFSGLFLELCHFKKDFLGFYRNKLLPMKIKNRTYRTFCFHI